MTLELQTRNCIACKKSFRVMSSSKQRTCSGHCLAEVEGRPELQDLWKKMNEASFEEMQANRKAFDLRKPNNVVKTETASVTALVTPTQHLEPAKPSEEKNMSKIIPLPKKDEAKKTTTITGSKDLQTEKSGPEKIRSGSLKTKGTTTPKTKSVAKSVSTPVVDSVTQQLVSTKPSESAVLVVSPSMNLLDSVSEHLYGLMRGLIANRPPADIQKFNPDEVNAACNCAKNIREMMKLKLDALKVQLKA